MEILDIKENAQIICDTYLHNEIRYALLNKHGAIKNVSLQSVDTYLSNLIVSSSEDVVTYEYVRLLKTVTLQYFKDVAFTSEFLNEVTSLILEFKKYHISFDTLPEKDSYQKELKMIVQTLSQYELPIETTLRKFKEISDFSGYYIYDLAPTLYKKHVYEHMVAHGAVYLHQTHKEPTSSLYYTLNKREEVEALARYIIEHNVDVEKAKLTILNEEYREMVKQIFPRYEIPYYFLKTKKHHRLVYKYLALLSYYKNPNSISLQRIIEEDVFVLPNMSAFYEYITMFNKNIDDDFYHVEHASITYDVIDEREYTSLLELERKAREVQEVILPYLQVLQQKLSFEEAIACVDSIICECHVFKDVEDNSVLRKIRDILRTALPYFEDDIFELVYAKIEQITLSFKEEIKGLSVSTLQEPQGYKPYHFMLGANSDNYPQFASKKGVFSEVYLKETKYPSVDDRFALHSQNLEANLCSSDYFVAFYAVSDYTGKEKEASLEIEQFIGKEATYYKLSYATNTFDLQDTLQKQNAKALFFKENTIYGSISSFEKYSNCPFKYFVAHGLKVKEPNDRSFSNAKSGTLMHYVLETLGKAYAKQYPETSKEQVERLLDSKIKEIEQVYPYLIPSLQVVKKRVVDSIMYNFTYMKNMEEHSSLTPTLFEHEFEMDVNLEDITLHLKGFIDRIDTNNDYIAIIDYKSSKHTLSEEEAFSGLKLQLLTYLMNVATTFDKRVFGGFYYSFRNADSNMDYATFNGKNNTINKVSEEDYEKAFFKDKKMNGWVFDKNIEVMDDDYNHINGIRIKKDGSFYKETTIYNIDGVIEHVKKVYQRIVDELKCGNVKIEPSNCDYCKYRAICHYKGYQVEKQTVEIDTSIYQVHKGEEY